MKIRQATLVIATALLATAAVAQNDSIPVGPKGACMEGPLAGFGQYIGDWDIEDSQLNQDGSE